MDISRIRHFPLRGYANILLQFYMLLDSKESLDRKASPFLLLETLVLIKTLIPFREGAGPGLNCDLADQERTSF